MRKLIDKNLRKKNRGYILRLVALTLVMALAVTMCFSGCGNKNSNYDPLEGVETTTVTDDTGREVEIPKDITAIAPSGSTATMMLLPIASDLLVGLASSPSSDQIKYMPEEIVYLPTFGQFYGSKSTLNMESLIDAKPQVIIDLGDKKNTIRKDMASIQNQTGIPTLFYEGSLRKMADTYRTLGQLFGREEEAEEIAKFIDKTIAMAEEKSAQIDEKDKIKILYGTGATGLAVNAKGSSQAQVIDLIGAENAVVPEEITDKGGGTIVNMESLYKDEPDMIILAEGGPYGELKSNEWSELKAVKNDKFYEIPGDPYSWMSAPPSVNMVLGVWWLGQLAYPDVYNDYDMVEVAQEYYKLFWHYDLSEDEAKEMLSKSYFK
ncbi:MAG: ABC transporter substrate-binding protein [Bacillota bacterium]|nr:ABC transporter substrate-binding protein [Bacillota bacterium]